MSAHETKTKKINDKQQKVFCYFHNADLDGWSSSAIVKMKYPHTEFFGYDYNDDIILANGYDLVFIVDLSLTIDETKMLQKNNKKVIWIDHHARKIEQLENIFTLEGLRDKENNHSACILTWKYLFHDKKIPHILETIEDIDLWKFKLPYTDEITTALSIECMKDRDKLIFLMKWWDDEWENYTNRGERYIKMRENEIEFFLTTMKIRKLSKYKVGVINTSVHISQTGHAILENNPNINVAVIWHVAGDIIKVSLRSRGDIDVAEIAMKFGGGGHKPASGFSINTKKDTELSKLFYDVILK